MNKKEKARPGATNTETGGKSATNVHTFLPLDLRLSQSHSTTGGKARQAGILDYIPRTKDAALTGRELAQLLHTSTRAVEGGAVWN